MSSEPVYNDPARMVIRPGKQNWANFQRERAIVQVEDADRLLAKVAAGEHRTGYITALAIGLPKFYEAFTPDDFRLYARTVKDCALDKRNAWRTRLRAVEGVIRFLRDLVDRMAGLQGTSLRVQQQLETLIGAYLEEFGPDDFERMAGVFKEVFEWRRRMHEIHGKRDNTATHVAHRMNRILLYGLDIIKTMQRLRSAPRPVVIAPDDPRIVRARSELSEMDRLIEQVSRAGSEKEAFCGLRESQEGGRAVGVQEGPEGRTQEGVRVVNGEEGDEG